MYIPSKYYTGKDNNTENEFEHIFSKSWLFAGFTDELANNNDFVTFEVFGRSVVVQNFNGTIAAFKNVCAHRFNRIQTEDRGNRTFTCKYHGWTYNSEGKPVGIPKRDTFDPQELACVHLTKYLVETCGKFVFVKIDTYDTETLRDFLGSFYDELIRIGQFLNKQLICEDIPHAANWKLLVENVIEAYHCPMLHPETLLKSGFCRTPVTNFKYDGKHATSEGAKVTTEAMKSFNNKKLTFLESRPYKHDSFIQIHLYPTFLFASTEGYLFYFGTILPVNSEKSILRVRYFSTFLADSDKPFLQKAFYDANVQAGLKILKDEDLAVLEQCQKGLMESADGSVGILSNVEEIRLKKFQDIYLKDMKYGE